MMVLIFSLSAIMLCPRTRVIFKAPVPHIHETVGKLLIPWGMTYLIFLPDIYLTLNGVVWRDHAYVVVSMLTLTICLSTSSWMYMSYLQQGVRQRILQPLTVFLPTILMVWYAVSPEEWLLLVFLCTYVVETLLIVGYYFKLYLAFVRDIKTNYSNLSTQMFHGIWAQWAASILSVSVFLIAMVVDEIMWNIIDIFVNTLSLFVLVYSSERLMPLPEKEVESEVVPAEVHTDVSELTKTLQEVCERTLVFCNPDLSLQDLAVALGTNRTYLSRWFMENDTNFYTYVNGMRAEHAAHLLVTTDEPVSKVQLAAGFGSSTTFRKYFVERFGCSPLDYRKRRKAPK